MADIDQVSQKLGEFEAYVHAFRHEQNNDRQLLQGIFDTTIQLKTIPKKLDELKSELDVLKRKVEADIRDLEQLKNRGTGLVIGVGLALTALGSQLGLFFKAVRGWFV